MSAEPVTAARPSPWTRADRPDRAPIVRRIGLWTALVALASGFVLIGGGNLDLGPIEARLGLSAGEGIGPFGQVFGGWEPALWPAQVAPSVLWAWGEAGGIPTSASVRWPAAIAGILAGLILAHRAWGRLGGSAGVLTAACWFGSVALIDRSAGAGLDLIAGLATVAALDRILARGSDLIAGLWAALAFLGAGWPPLLVIALATLVVGRREAMLTPALMAPPLVTCAAWSAWALSVTRAQVWASALALPLTRHSAWGMAVGVVALGLPWSPIAALTASRSVRDGWPALGRTWVIGWLQVTMVSLFVGTVIPGMASAARLPALAGLAVTAAACCDRAWAGALSTSARRGFQALAVSLVALWVAIVVVGGLYLGFTVPYYHRLVIVLIALAVPTGLVALASVLKADARRALLALAAVAVGLKLAHWGYYVPEWNYRRSQGPWGRAIGQWVPPRWPIYMMHTWPADLAFATGRPARQLAYPRHLAFQEGTGPRFVLLLASEFEHWPKDAPALIPMARFQDERGGTRVLARTEGEFSLKFLDRQKPED